MLMLKGAYTYFLNSLTSLTVTNICLSSLSYWHMGGLVCEWGETFSFSTLVCSNVFDFLLWACCDASSYSHFIKLFQPPRCFYLHASPLPTQKNNHPTKTPFHHLFAWGYWATYQRSLVLSLANWKEYGGCATNQASLVQLGSAWFGSVVWKG
jgi:hypothetical protein